MQAERNVYRIPATLARKSNLLRFWDQIIRENVRSLIENCGRKSRRLIQQIAFKSFTADGFELLRKVNVKEMIVCEGADSDL